MTRDVTVAGPEQTIQEAARMMQKIDSGVLPVGSADRLIGMITDRDIALRAVGTGKGPDTRVREVMTEEVLYCFEDQEIEEVAHNMGDNQLRRLPVLNRDKRLVGILSLADVATSIEFEAAGDALSEISRPSGT
ncbi:CBS domain-containing protein [Rhodovarius crocodyli]|uniref:CBS domain-containing protein n=2 Tax=Rhodovarius crocodyli TaxID=1979269 RepID=A0A437MDW3_9PROT|nr:CBS domain-containing protein [Rhodovarius crocodyli]